MMSNGPPPARPDGTVDDARWLFPHERAPPPRDEGCKQHGFGDPAHHTSNCSPPNPSPPTKSSPPSIMSTSPPTLTTMGGIASVDMGGIAPVDASSPPAVPTEWLDNPAPQEDRGDTLISELCRDFSELRSELRTTFDELRAIIVAAMGMIEPVDTCPPPAVLTEWRGGDATPVASGRSLSPTLPHPMSYVGAILSTVGGDYRPSSHVLQSTPTMANELAAITLHQTARRRKRPRRRPGRRNGPRAPNPPHEAIPSHPLPTMGGPSLPTTTHLTSARANDWDHRPHMSSPSLPPMTLPSPSHQPFTFKGGDSISSGGDSMIPSASKLLFYLRGSAHDKSTILVVFVGVTALEPLIRLSLFADANISLGPPTPHPRPLRCGLFPSGSIGFFCSLEILLGDSFSWLKVLFFQVLPFLFCIGYIYLIVALVPFVFGFSAHLLGYHCPLSYGCAKFKCGGVLVSYP